MTAEDDQPDEHEDESTDTENTKRNAFVDMSKFLSPETLDSMKRLAELPAPALPSYLADAIEQSNKFTPLYEQLARIQKSGVTLPTYEISRIEMPDFDFTPDDSPQRTAEHTENISRSIEGLVEITRALTHLTEASVEQSREADKRNKRMSRLSLIVSGASATAAITSVILFIISMNN